MYFHHFFRIITVLLIILDVTLVITALVLECDDEPTIQSLGVLTPLPNKNDNWYEVLDNFMSIRMTYIKWIWDDKYISIIIFFLSASAPKILRTKLSVSSTFAFRLSSSLKLRCECMLWLQSGISLNDIGSTV